MTSVPVMSAGIRSGVNWMRLKSSDRHLASVEIISVLARPGTPSRMQWPRLNMAISNSSMTWSWPTMTRLSCLLMFLKGPFQFLHRLRCRCGNSIRVPVSCVLSMRVLNGANGYKFADSDGIATQSIRKPAHDSDRAGLPEDLSGQQSLRKRKVYHYFW